MAVEKRTWKEFQDNKLLWWVNKTLHLFGWAIVLEVDDDYNIKDVYPARVSHRGFDTITDKLGYSALSKYLKDNADTLYKEAKN